MNALRLCTHFRTIPDPTQPHISGRTKDSDRQQNLLLRAHDTHTHARESAHNVRRAFSLFRNIQNQKKHDSVSWSITRRLKMDTAQYSRHPVTRRHRHHLICQCQCQWTQVQFAKKAFFLMANDMEWRERYFVRLENVDSCVPEGRWAFSYKNVHSFMFSSQLFRDSNSQNTYDDSNWDEYERRKSFFCGQTAVVNKYKTQTMTIQLYIMIIH